MDYERKDDLNILTQIEASSGTIQDAIGVITQKNFADPVLIQ